MASAPRIFLGIDYGTTFTGLAWAHWKVGQAPITVDDINVFRKWPGDHTEDKVPSEISYSQTIRGKEQWGKDIDERSETFKWTKLELQHRKPVEELAVLRNLMKGIGLINKTGDEGESEEIPEHLIKSPEDVLTDFLVKVSRQWYRDLASRGVHTLENVPLDLVISHPVGWTYEALNKIFRAVLAAFPKTLFRARDNLYLITEPEACSTYTVAELVKESRNTLLRGDCFVLCDAGGGTIDIASYYVESLEPLKLIRIGDPKGRECGATFIDREFFDVCAKELKGVPLTVGDSKSGGHLIMTGEGKELLGGFMRHKHGFTGVEDADIEVRFDVDSSSAVADTGVLPISTNDLVGMFAPSVNGAVEMIKNQVFIVRRTNRDARPCYVSTIFLAGGLSLNKHFQAKVREFARMNGNIAVQATNNGWSAVVRGCVLTGAGIGTQVPPKVTPARRYYGICLHRIYKVYDAQNPSNTYVDKYDGQRRISALVWLIRQGDLLFSDKEVKKEILVQLRFTRQEYEKQAVITIPFVAALVGSSSSRQEAPVTMSEIRKDTDTIVNMDVPLRSFNLETMQRNKFAQKKGRGSSNFTSLFSGFYRVDVTVQVRVSTTVKIRVKYEGGTLYTNEIPW